LRAGASGFLLKDATPEMILDAVRVIGAGNALLAPAVTRRLISEFAARARLRPPPQPQDLTPREREVFELLATGLANAEIATTLHLAEQTVKTHVSAVLLKLGLRDRVQAVVMAYESGVITPGGGRGRDEL
jgi:DNA-binding NarL/FixJ family response regulator